MPISLPLRKSNSKGVLVLRFGRVTQTELVFRFERETYASNEESPRL
jgi:hypothetical protein